MIGDFNIDLKNKKNNKDFKSFLHTFKLKILIINTTHTTEISLTLIYLIITNCSENLTILNVFTNSIADHDMKACWRKINNVRYKPKTIKFRNYAN